MIALGWTDRASIPPEPCAALPGPAGTLVTAPARHAATSAARLRLQSACAVSCAAFLPLAPTLERSPDAAHAWATAEGHALPDRIDAVRGMAQATLLAVAPPDPAPASEATSGAAWLSLRTRVQADRARRRAAAAQALRGRAGQDISVRAWPRGLALDLVARRDILQAQMVELLAHLRQADEPALAGWRLTLAGPLPVFALSFADRAA
ncbi:hypothetical protein [Roseivivax isoporae]|uniref:Gas vesicle protein n=1 Tax=Roseivivax isoporae LMG 25204 TaxID=1449351 RepID=X7FB67_9RHOB|nr:hypothetical protein [Roseivivax isoporae]ETX29361.1 hypothetical protein RISW2_01440 [Roseivivax isoporae LMG 25204]